MHLVSKLLGIALSMLVLAGATDDYCGIPAYPSELPKIDDITVEVERYNLMMTFVRHGDRSTIVKNCLPTFAPRAYTECDVKTSSFPYILPESAHPRPDIPMQTMPGKQVLEGNCHLGQLTERGYLMAYNNGLRFGAYLNRTFANDKGKLTMFSRSTDVHRTRATAEAFLVGTMDTLGPARVAAAEVSPLYFIDTDVDAVRMGSNMCETAPYIKEVYASDAWLQYKANVWDPLTREVAAALKMKTVDLNDVFDCAKINTCLGTPNPSPLSFDMLSRVEKAVTQYWLFGFSYNHTRSSKVFTGPLLMEILTELAQAAVDPDVYEPKASLFSGHDFGPMMNLASSLGILPIHPVWPPYHSMINMEVVYVPDQVRSYTRFMWQAKVVKPAFCDGAYYKDLCPTYVVMKYLSTLLPSTEDCPRIPQRSYKDLRAAIERAEVRMDKGTYKGANLKEVKAAITPLLQYKPVEQDEQPLSDVERWHRAFAQ